jgi:predicted membrane channel-forming protein YqfA (hemolysin III family)
MLAGAVLYTAGGLSYHRRWLNAFPTVFGYHEVFHVYVPIFYWYRFVWIMAQLPRGEPRG